MEDLLQSQIQDSCRLALPEGLKDLTADISREVLRAQPQNLYQFIADYLSVLLVAREHLFIASRVCDDVCKDQCWRDLEDELRSLSLSEEDVQEILKVVAKYFSRDEVNEGNLLQKLAQKTSIGEKELPAVQNAVRCAFLRHRIKKMAPDEPPSADELDETTLAANHTLKIYKKATEETGVNYDCVASKIQTAYRAYNVRRKREEPTQSRKSNEKVHFKDKKEKLAANLVKRCASKCSSMSLAGSFVSLPLYHPYSVLSEHRDPGEVDDVGVKETERTNIDYVAHAAAREQQELNDTDQKVKKTISFHNLLRVVEVDYHEVDEVEDEADEADYQSDDINEELGVEEEGIDRVSSDTDENQGNSDEMARTPTVSFNVLAGESSVEESDYGSDYLSSEMQRMTKYLMVDDQTNSHENTQNSTAVNTHYGGKEYSLKMRPDDDDNNLKELMKAVSSEVEITTENQGVSNVDRPSIEARDHHDEDADKKSYTKVISFHSLPEVVELDYVVDEADYESEEIEEDLRDEELGAIGEGMNEVPVSDMNERQDNEDDIARTESPVVSELADDESDLSEGLPAENGDGYDLGEISKMSGAELAHESDDFQANDHDNDNAPDILESMSVNTAEEDKQYKGSNFEMKPDEKDDDMSFELPRTISDEIKDD